MTYASSTASCPNNTPWAGGADAGGGVPNNSGREEKSEIKPVQNMRIVLFFDGTYNNKFNVAARKQGRLPSGIDTTEASFANDESNVARMADRLDPTSDYNGKAYDDVVNVYVEGIGTTILDSDSTYGGATGDGSTGVLAKVEKGIEEALSRLKSTSKSKRFEFIHFDTFGFSRGAAAARNAVHRILNGRIIPAGRTYVDLPSVNKSMTDSGFDVSELKIRFVGLYDTVASYGVMHWNDTRELKLDSISAADQVIQLAAADEHRKNFRLTDISSSKGGNSFELYLPGGHSDIGGGYNDNSTAKMVLWSESILRFRSTNGVEQRMEKELEWFRKEGWFTGPGNMLSGLNFTNGPSRVFFVAGRQTTQFNHYCFIPLNIMARRAGEQSLTFTNLQRVSGSFLLSVQSALRMYENRKRHSSKPSDWFNKSTTSYIPDMQRLRSQHLHFTSYLQDLTQEVTVGGALVDGIFGPMEPQYVDGKRARKIQDG